jgi:hypothetical protein
MAGVKGAVLQAAKRMAMAVALGLGIGLAGSAEAHHSFAVFFNTEAQMVKITGVVRDFQFHNPHGVITLAVAKGKEQITWRAETNSPSVLRRRGWTPESLHVGDKVTLEGWAAQDGSRYIRLRSAHLADGRPVGQPVG